MFKYDIMHVEYMAIFAISHQPLLKKDFGRKADYFSSLPLPTW